ncbi:hypothetical protein BC833DRAFT_616932 [Globomyces pollinis-pini]|nr:hypothetical protein BC833DRAFT_616932 [Globomyces pollinis-pini]
MSLLFHSFVVIRAVLKFPSDLDAWAMNLSESLNLKFSYMITTVQEMPETNKAEEKSIMKGKSSPTKETTPEEPQDGDVDADTEPVDEQSIIETLGEEDAVSLLTAGTQALAIGKYEEAADKLAVAVEIQVRLYGQYAKELAPTMYLYGKALLGAAIQKSAVLGEKIDKVKTVVEEPVAGSSNPNFVFEGDEEDLEDEDAKNLDDIELPPADDLELAWENLDVARIILSSQTDDKHFLELADIHLALGDVSVESENFEQANKDYKVAVDLKVEHCPENFRELAEAHFKFGLSLELCEMNEEAIEQVNFAVEALKKRLELLENKSDVDPKGKKSMDDVTSEIQELKGFVTEMELKLNDLHSLLDKEEEGEDILPPRVETRVDKEAATDISSLVKKSKSPSKRKLEESEEIVKKVAKTE